MKTCSKCLVEKPIESFQFRKETQKYRAVCNQCRASAEKERRVEKADEIRQKDRDRWNSDQNGRRTKSLERLRKRYHDIISDKEGHDKEKARNRLRAKRFASYWRAMVAKRRATKLNATTVWLSSDDKWLIQQAYELAYLRTEKFGFAWDVDHIVPLQSKKVCGLHVPWNLQVIPSVVNKSKGNRFTE